MGRRSGSRVSLARLWLLWEEGLKRTVEWYKTYSVRYVNIEQALVAHPRIETAVSAI